MNSKNIPKYIVICTMLIALFYKVFPTYYYNFINRVGFYFHVVIFDIILILCLIYFIIKAKDSFNITLKKVIKYSFFFMLSSEVISNIWFFIYQKQIFSIVTSPYFIYKVINSVLFVFWAIIIISKIKKTKYSFNELLISLLSFLIVSDIFLYCWHLIDSYVKSDISISNVIPSFPSFSIPSFSISNFSFRTLFTGIIESPTILLLFVVFYYSSYVLFVNYKKKGIYSIIPIKKDLIFLEISKKPTWWIIFLLIPFIRLIPKYLINVELAKVYHKKKGYAFGMTLIPWFFYGKLTLNKT